jgi:hypothetical protein
VKQLLPPPNAIKLAIVVLAALVGLLLSTTMLTTSVNAQRGRTTTPRSTQPSTGRTVQTPTPRTRSATTSSGQIGAAGSTATALAGRAAGTATAAAGSGAGSATAYAVKVGPTLTALAVQVKVTATLPANEAAAALTSYASSVLGTTVTVTKAGGLTADVTKNMTQTQQGADAQVSALKLATKSYGGVLSNGAAALSYGTGTVSGDINIDVQGASFGVYSLIVQTGASVDAASALSLAQRTFPNLAGMTYATYTVSKGYAWYATSYVSAIDPATHKVVTMTEAVILYVLQGSSGKTATVSATVGRGDFAALIEAPTN